MNWKRVLPFTAAGVAAALMVWQVAKKRAIGLDATQKDQLLSAIRSAYDSTLAAFDTSGGDEGEFDARDARAASDAERLRSAFADVQPFLGPRFRPAVSLFVDSINAAQVQIMAFAINRKNRGLPDAAQTEAEGEDREAFRRNAGPLYTQLITALS